MEDFEIAINEYGFVDSGFFAVTGHVAAISSWPGHDEDDDEYSKDE